MGMIAGKRYSGEEKRRLRKLLEEIFLLGGATSMEDFVPLARWLGFDSMRRRIERAGKEMDEFLQGLIEERRKLGKWKENNSTIIIDVMLALQEKEPEDYSDVVIKGLIVSLFIAGTETASGTMEWAMALLVNHPAAMKKVKDEVGEHVGHARLVMDSDISKLRYLNNVIKETLRLFPPGHLLAPHESSEDCTVAGLHVPKGTMLLVNVYAMHRDPEYWEDPLEFKPKRFDAESKGGQGYKYNPFGSGRRRCPGETMAWKVMGLEAESVIHILSSCQYVRHIWNHFGTLFGAQIGQMELSEIWGTRGTSSRVDHALRGGWEIVTMAITWSIWGERNRRCFQEKQRVFLRIIRDISFLIISWLDAAPPAKRVKLEATANLVKRSLEFTSNTPGRATEGGDSSGEDQAPT